MTIEIISDQSPRKYETRWTSGSGDVVRFLIWSSGGPTVQWSGTIYAILEEGIMGNIHMK